MGIFVFLHFPNHHQTGWFLHYAFPMVPGLCGYSVHDDEAEGNETGSNQTSYYNFYWQEASVQYSGNILTQAVT